MEENQCVFCQIVSGTIKSSVIYQDENLVGILDINPATMGHVILLPRTHYSSLYEMPQNLSLGFFNVARVIGYSLLISMGATNVDLIYSQELRSGNFTPHALIHIIPRYKDDNVNYAWQPNTMSEEDIKMVSQAVIGAIDKIRNQEAPAPATPVQQTRPAPAPVVKPVQSQPEPNKEEKLLELKKKIVVF